MATVWRKKKIQRTHWSLTLQLVFTFCIVFFFFLRLLRHRVSRVRGVADCSSSASAISSLLLLLTADLFTITLRFFFFFLSWVETRCRHAHYVSHQAHTHSHVHSLVAGSDRQQEMRRAEKSWNTLNWEPSFFLHCITHPSPSTEATVMHSFAQTLGIRVWSWSVFL